MQVPFPAKRHPGKNDLQSEFEVIDDARPHDLTTQALGDEVDVFQHLVPLIDPLSYP